MTVIQHDLPNIFSSQFQRLKTFVAQSVLLFILRHWLHIFFLQLFVTYFQLQYFHQFVFYLKLCSTILFLRLVTWMMNKQLVTAAGVLRLDRVQRRLHQLQMMQLVDVDLDLGLKVNPNFERSQEGVKFILEAQECRPFLFLKKEVLLFIQLCCELRLWRPILHFHVNSQFKFTCCVSQCGLQHCQVDNQCLLLIAISSQLFDFLLL